MHTRSLLVKKLEEIESILSVVSSTDKYENIGVLAGNSGIALFHFYYARLLQDESKADPGAEILSESINSINEGYSFPTFCSGIAGAAWAIEILKEEEMIDIDTDNLLSGLDDYLLRAMRQMGTKNNFYDFLHGVMGIGFYFLKRHQNTKSTTLKNRYKEIIVEVISLLDTTAIKKDHTAKWEAYLIQEEKLKGFNLSLSHGIVGIINFLSRIAEYPEFYEKVEKLINDTINYVLSCEKVQPSSSLFPSWIYRGMGNDENARLGWCYGDLGIGITFWRAGKVLNNDSIAEKGLEILKHSSGRRNLEEAKVKDSGLCHGAFGIMHIYNYMYQQTKEESFKETSDFWLQRGLDMAIHNDGYAGFMQWNGGENPGWRNETNLLEGIAGIGLSIISYLAPFQTKWDECLLIS